MLGADDPLPARPQRILVVGVSGVGKTTLAGRIASALGIPHTEIDALYHGPNWSYRESFLAEVTALAEGAAWVTEWQYRTARPILLARADLMVWLDLPIRVTLTRLIVRTVRRRVHRTVLWNGNVEGPLWKFFTGRDHIIRWGISTRAKYKRMVPDLERQPAHPDVVRLATTREVAAWLAGPLAAASASDR
ncbi:AAA family ATPase [Amnibacterium flavum]|uniref:AAA family ATPase n=1 Tax=Amnibacterium flavum TaxID=2173173 RepID=A0A2V1HR57_9MICO|nr:AAA family ATPase [Amnibacterium flavum]PVZ94132.1 AAA family ATPase [Amnibacterium flavum]